MVYLRVALSIVLLSSCSDDGGDDLNPKAAFSIYGLDYALESGVLWHGDNNFVANKIEYTFLDVYTDSEGNTVEDDIKGFSLDGSVNQVGNFIVSLYGEGITYKEDVQGAVGKGAVITIHFSSENLMELEEGSYEYSERRKASTFRAFSSSMYDFNAASQWDAGDASSITEGNISVSKIGDQYEFKLNCKTEYGSDVKGTYLGKCELVDIKQKLSMNHMEDVQMSAVFDTIHAVSKSMWGVHESAKEDIYATAVYNTSTSSVMSISNALTLTDIDKERIELAMSYDRESNSVFFKSPIELRAEMWRGTGGNPDVIFPCHTKFQCFPEDFTEEDFNNLNSSDDFVFPVTENIEGIPLDSELPKLILFETGNGLKGAIKITNIIPVGEEISYGWFGSVTTKETNPVVTFEMKTPIIPATVKLK